MNIALVHPETIDFNRLIRVMRQTSYGCLLESFIRVDIGQDSMMAAWDAFRDIAMYFHEEYEGEKEMVSQFLMTLEDEVPFMDMGMNPWI